MKRKLLYAVGFCVVSLAVLVCIILSPKTQKVTDFAMDTVICVTVTSKNPKEDIRAAIDEVNRIDALMSVSGKNSEIRKINSAKPGEKTKVSPEVYFLIEKSLEISEKTGGVFDITVNPLSELWNITSPNPKVPEDDKIKELLEKVNYKNVLLDGENFTVTLKEDNMSISLGAVAKGYAADCAAKVLKERGVEDALIDLGGNIYVIGTEKTIGIQTPFEKRGEFFHKVSAKDTSVVTSGGYERYFEEDGKNYHHIIDTKDGYPADSDLLSATVVCESSYLADALSTALFASGEEKAKEIIKNFDNVSVILLRKDKTVIRLGN